MTTLTKLKKVDFQGESKTLRDAIRLAMCVGPLHSAEERLLAHVRDFLAQKFGVALSGADADEFQRLDELFKTITFDKPAKERLSETLERNEAFLRSLGRG